MPVIDADAHVIETDRTWEFMDAADAQFRPVTMQVNDPGATVTMREFWRIGRRAIARRVFDTARTGATVETQELLDIEARLRHMDELGVDVHVVYPALFLLPFTTQPEVEAALYKTYNRWMADIWAKGNRRLLWAALAPTMTMDLAVKEIAWAKEHGACAVFMRGTENGLMLSDPHFHPLYAQAAQLNLPICIHSGNGSLALDDLYSPDTAILYRAKLAAIGAIHEIILSGVPMKFPDLRWGVIETSSVWVPYLCHDLAMRMARIFDTQIDRTDILRKNRVYCACQTDDDLSYIVRYAGETTP